MPGLRQSVTGCVRAWSKNGGESLCRSTFRPRRRGFEASHLVLCKPGRLCYTLPAREHLFRLFLGSSAVEHSTVNRMVAGSNPARGAKSNQSLRQESDRLSWSRFFVCKPCAHMVGGCRP